MVTINTLDYLADYYELEPSLFRESDNLHKLFQSIFSVYHEQQIDLLWFSENILNIDTAENFHLDFIGKLVGQDRLLVGFNAETYFGFEGAYKSETFGSSLDPEVGGFWNSRSYFNAATARRLSDDEYRRIIKARIISNHSNCSPNDLLEVINLITNRTDNTSQTVQHGIITVKSKDNTGILSYFVDRLLYDDNILPIAAGVRVGLEQSASDSSGGGIPDTDWEVKKVYEGSTGSKVSIDAVRTKNNLEVKSSIEVTPTVGQISDRIKSGEYGAEVNKAVLDIDSEAINWVLDPNNNRVKYTVNVSSEVAMGEYCRAESASSGHKFDKVTSIVQSYGTTYYCTNSDGQKWGIIPYGRTQDSIVEKYISISTVAAKVISNSEAGHAESKNLLVSVVSVLASMRFYNPLF